MSSIYEVTEKDFDGMTDAEVLALDRRCHKIWSHDLVNVATDHRLGKLLGKLIQVHAWAVTELSRRNLPHASGGPAITQKILTDFGSFTRPAPVTNVPAVLVPKSENEKLGQAEHIAVPVHPESLSTLERGDRAVVVTGSEAVGTLALVHPGSEFATVEDLPDKTIRATGSGPLGEKFKGPFHVVEAAFTPFVSPIHIDLKVRSVLPTLKSGDFALEQTPLEKAAPDIETKDITPEVVHLLSDADLKKLAVVLRERAAPIFAEGRTPEDLVNAMVFLLAEAKERGLSIARDATLDVAAERLTKDAGRPSDPVPDLHVARVRELHNKLPESMVVCPGFVGLTGSLLYAKGDRKPNDVDVAYKITDPDALPGGSGTCLKLERAIKELTGLEVNHFTAPMGSAWTNFPAYDLVLLRRDNPEVEIVREDFARFIKSESEEGVEKRFPKGYNDYPKGTDRPLKFVYQHHWRGGKSVHGDMRFEQTDALLGFTNAVQTPGIEVPSLDDEKSASVKGAENYAERNPGKFKINPNTGEFAARRTAAGEVRPTQIAAVPKAQQPKAWLDVEGVVQPGGIGATTNLPATFHIVDSGTYTPGARKSTIWEIFVEDSKDDVFLGRYFWRPVVRKILPPSEEQTIEGIQLTLIRPTDQLPNVLAKSSRVDRPWIPPKGWSALPKVLQKKVPPKLRYWTKSSESERKKLRNELYEVWKEEGLIGELQEGTFKLIKSRVEKQPGPIRTGDVFEARKDRLVVVGKSAPDGMTEAKRKPWFILFTIKEPLENVRGERTAKMIPLDAEKGDTTAARTAAREKFAGQSASRAVFAQRLGDTNYCVSKALSFLAKAQKQEPKTGKFVLQRRFWRVDEKTQKEFWHVRLDFGGRFGPTITLEVDPLKQKTTTGTYDVRGPRIALERVGDFSAETIDDPKPKEAGTVTIEELDSGKAQVIGETTDPQSLTVRFSGQKLEGNRLLSDKGDGVWELSPAPEPQEVERAWKRFVPFVHREETEIEKAEGGGKEKKRLVYGIVYEPYKVDAQGDWANEETIERAAHRWLAESRNMKEMHQYNTEKVVPVESYIAPGDFRLGSQEVKKGSWILVSKILDEDIWAKVERGEYTGYSLGGRSTVREDTSPPRAA